jgi:DNA-binding phage protein
MKTVEEIRSALSDRNLRKVAYDAGISSASVYRLMKEDSKPLYETVKALSDYLEGKA